MTKTHEVPLQVRFADTDAFGHVNNAAFAHYVEIGRLEFFREVVGIGVGDPEQGTRSLILARLALDFRAQVRFPAELRVRTRVARLGSSSVTLRQEIVGAEIPGEGVAAEADSVVVHFDYAAQRSVPLPDRARELLAPYVLEPARG